MFWRMLKSKIHRARVTDADLNYEGSITVDSAVLEAAGMHPYEMVHVFNITNGARIETYTMEGERGSGTICLNGAAARLVSIGDLIIIVAYVLVPPEQAGVHRPTIIVLDENNSPIS